MSQHLLLLTEIGRIIGEARTLQEVLDRAARLVAERMNTDVCSIYLLDAARQKLTLAATEGLATDAVGRASLTKGQGLTWHVLERMEPVVAEEASEHPEYVYLPETHEEPFHSYLGLPLQLRGQAIGVLYVQTRKPRHFTEDEVQALSAIASQIAPVVDNARLLAMVAEEAEQVEADDRVHETRHFRGTSCSPGVVTGKILRIQSRPQREPLRAPTVRDELERLKNACASARRELLAMQDWLRERHAEEAALVFSVQLMMLEDPSFEGRMRAAVSTGQSAFAAISDVTRALVKRFATLKDPFFRERSEDVRDLAGRLQRHVRKPKAKPTASLAGRVAVLADLAPSRLVSLCAEGVAAVLAGGGGATSHAALLARSLDLPLVVGLGDFLREARDGQYVLVDASAGEVVLEPPDDLVVEATQAATAGVQALRDAYGDTDKRSGRMRFEANVSLWGDAVRAREQGADGIGLYRTEFAFLMRPDLPGEAEQAALYRRVVDAIAPHPVTFRLLDAGGDKLVPGLGLSAEPNPFLGYRSLRLLLDHTEILLSQTRAILSALEGTTGRLLVPMVSSVEEFRAVRTVLLEAGLDLPPFGAMIELPCALLQVEEIAEEADFLCVGTNDLTQHLLGVDRTNARVTRYFDMCHPSVVRALARIALAAEAAGKPLSICGEGASDPVLLALWLGLGVERLAVHATRVRILRTLEAQLDLAATRAAIPDLLLLDNAAAIRARLEDLAAPEVRQFSRGQFRAPRPV